MEQIEREFLTSRISMNLNNLTNVEVATLRSACKYILTKTKGVEDEHVQKA